MEERQFDYDILPDIQKRWSPRAFDKLRPVGRETLMALLEAARYAPSCSNEQPWRFLIATGDEQRERLVSVLSEHNRTWARQAPVLLLILSEKTFSSRGTENRWHQFDAGTAWGYLSLEAQSRGLVTHAMAGFSVDAARKAFSIPASLSVIAALAIGYYGQQESLPEKLQAREHPATRKPLGDLIFSYK